MTAQDRWIQFAKEDFILAKAAFEKEIFNQVCFHSQQAIEKSLKAFLSKNQQIIPKTHSLCELLTICKNLDSSFLELGDSCIKLDKYYIPTRYPDALPGTGPEGLPGKKDAEESISILESAFDWIHNKL